MAVSILIRDGRKDAVDSSLSPHSSPFPFPYLNSFTYLNRVDAERGASETPTPHSSFRKVVRTHPRSHGV